MKIAFPTQEDIGLESIVYGHFGSANVFIVTDTETDACETVLNNDLNHQHGKCQPLVALGGIKVDAVVVGGIGGGALMKLNKAGVVVYRGTDGTVSDNLDLYNSGKLAEFTKDLTCSHNGIDGCAH